MEQRRQVERRGIVGSRHESIWVLEIDLALSAQVSPSIVGCLNGFLGFVTLLFRSYLTLGVGQLILFDLIWVWSDSY